MPGIFHGVEHASGAQSGFLAGVDPNHVPGLVAALVVPVAAWAFLKVTRRAAEHGFAPAQRFIRGYDDSSLVTRVAALLLLLTGFIHLGLVSGHWGVDPRLATLFALNGLAFVAVAIGAFTFRRWRLVTTVLLVATIVAYLQQVGGHHEDADPVGMLTKLIELGALALVLIPDRAVAPRSSTAFRWTGAVAAVLFATILTGTITWATGLTTQQDEHTAPAAELAAASPGVGEQIPAMHHMAGTIMQRVPSTPPTTQQRAAADQLAADTRAGIAKYEDLKVAIADGYKASTGPNGQTVHYNNWSYNKDGKILDPTRPEALVYANTKHGPMLLGAMYMMQNPGQPGPDIGGSLTQWHVHANVCWSVTSMTLAGLLTPFGTCPSGSLHITSAAMMHVWTVPNPNGNYGDLDPAWLKQLVDK